MKYVKPIRTFEKNGAVNPESSYHVPLDNVVNSDKQDLETMVNQGKYFSMFAPRQSGKTTFLEEIRAHLHKDKTYAVILLSFERYSTLDSETFYRQIQKELYPQLIHRLAAVECDKLDKIKDFLDSHALTGHLSFGELFQELNRIIEFKKIIIFIDEFDGMPQAELESFLTSLRYLYQQYKRVKQKALYSVGLVGIRNITKLVVGGVSPFNIADQVELPPFSLNNVRDLYRQYTDETNQPFSEEAVRTIHEETAGQPWLVNRLGTILTLDVKPETLEPINERDVEQAITLLLNERNNHFDNIYEKAKQYKETFVEIIFDHVEYSPYEEDQSWLEQYGLITNKDGHAVVTNNIYKALHLKAFFKELKAYEKLSALDYELPGGKLDMNRILLDFEKYITRIGVSAFYEKQKPYEKTGQFLLTAWLYQFVRGGNGDLHYEMKSGLGRLDVLLSYKGEKYIIETKVNRHDDLIRIIEEGALQLSGKYLATEGVSEGYLVIFDTRTAVGALCEPRYYDSGEKRITVFNIAIGKES